MNTPERVGLDLIREIVTTHLQLDVRSTILRQEHKDAIEAALRWIARQKKIDDKRREKRGVYRKGRS